jgi:hypothetical protein
MAGQLLLHPGGGGGYLGTIRPLEALYKALIKPSGPYKGLMRPQEALLYPDSPFPTPLGAIRVAQRQFSDTPQAFGLTQAFKRP